MNWSKPTQTLLGATAAALVICAFALHAGEITNTSPDTKTEQAKIERYLDTISAVRTVIASSNLVSTSSQYALVNWLTSTNKQIRSLTSGKYLIILSKASTTNQNAYAVRRVTGLETNKVYIQIQVIPDGLACPEFHGVMDPKPLRLVAFWGEGA